MSERLFTKEHEWVSVEDNTATIGISEYAQEQLGDLVYIELPEVNDGVGRGDDFAVVESVKTASEVYSPVTGKIIEVNEELIASPELLTGEDAWIAKVTIEDETELADLMNAEKYQDYISGL